MTQMEERKRPAPGAELFIGEAEMHILAELGDSAFDSESDDSGLLTGRVFHDILGPWATVTGFSRDWSDADDATGWFRTSERYGTEMSGDDIARHTELFGDRTAFAVMIDPPNSQMAMYKIEDGEPVKVGAAILEGF